MLDWIPWVVAAFSWPILYKTTGISVVSTGITLVIFGLVLTAINWE